MKFITPLALAMVPGFVAARDFIPGVPEWCFNFRFQITSITYEWKEWVPNSGADVVTDRADLGPGGHRIAWGDSNPDFGKSKLEIEGKNRGVSLPKTVRPNNEFTIAKLTHVNNPLITESESGTSVTNVTLCVSIEASYDGTMQSFDFEYDIGIEETINETPCPDWALNANGRPSGGACADRVFVLNDPSPHEIVTMVGDETEKAFEIDLIGFRRQGDIIEEGMYWLTKESRQTNADLRASLYLTECPGGGYGGGDPHFQTFTGNWYDFHGGCDMHLVDAPHFGENGLTIDVRTKTRDWYSFIETAAIKIGDDVLEVSGYGTYFLNGVEGAELPKMMDGKYPVTKTAVNKKRHEFVIALDNDQSIVVKTFKDLVSVSVQGAKEDSFISSRGLMGDFKTGKVFSRDGKRTILSDPSAIAREWQVRDDETVLFQSKQGPQYPEMCNMPKKQVAPRLGNTVARDTAEKACAHWENPEIKEMCVQDVIKTGDVEIAAETI